MEEVKIAVHDRIGKEEPVLYYDGIFQPVPRWGKMHQYDPVLRSKIIILC